MHTSYAAFVTSDQYNAGLACDGRPYVAEYYYVMIENEAGRRFSHTRTFYGTEQGLCPETGEVFYPDLREQAIKQAERLAARVNAAFQAGRGVDWTYWCEVDPAYGSDEYVNQGTEAKRAFTERNTTE